ncbi:MAG: c-type cytochrome domain-containing protein [Planctomycetota bacterium]
MFLCAFTLASHSVSFAFAEDEANQPTQADELKYALDSEGRLVQFERDIAPIFNRHCSDCHVGDSAKADFNMDDSELVMDYIEPESAADSFLYTDYLLAEDEDLLMPPRSHGGPMSAGELALIRTWIDEGAHWPENATISGDTEIIAAQAIVPAVAATLPMRVWMAQGFLHPATVHFPIALLLLGAAFVVVGWKWPVLGTQIPLACLIFGALTSIASTAMGFAFAVERGYGAWDRFDAEIMTREVFWHRWSAVVVTVLATGFAIVALMAIKKQSARLTAAWKVGLLACAAMVGAVGHQGGEMSYGEDFYPKAYRTLMGLPDPDDAEAENGEASAGGTETAGSAASSGDVVS